MGGLIFIIPIMAFDVWLFSTTGRRELQQWLALRQWRKIALVAAIGLALAIWFTFFIEYSAEKGLKVKGFPIPVIFYHLEKTTWTQTVLPNSLRIFGTLTDLLTGFAMPFVPYKIAEFLKVVKAEIR